MRHIFNPASRHNDSKFEKKQDANVPNGAAFCYTTFKPYSSCYRIQRLISRGELLLEKLKFAKLSKKFSALNRNVNFITAFHKTPPLDSILRHLNPVHTGFTTLVIAGGNVA
jgi:hypothetical protein